MSALTLLCVCMLCALCGSSSLNEMFQEVEELMEDTQHLLDEAVDQITTESEKFSSSSSDPLSSFSNETLEANTRTDETHLSFSHVEMSGQWNSPDHECMVDEDCAAMTYCLYEIHSSRCLPCIPTDMPCVKDEECCSNQMCVWGQCTPNAIRGTEGTICQGQSDCRPSLCCAFQRVCNPKPEKGQSCLSQPNLLADMLAWDQEGPRDHCACADNLQCQPHGRGSVCGE